MSGNALAQVATPKRFIAVARAMAVASAKTVTQRVVTIATDAAVTTAGDGQFVLVRHAGSLQVSTL